ncbi:hypothetical protein ABD91_25955 [Lysinibacillus sphaericus]|uniref:hypothetical protein n=1 Tax=Lysinibacillus sphaericus TaxID=1421 RepID=UPI0018CF4E4A|nr:hypothetical protein [Lysinibacillus sphaericus]MBG9694179.1 hypothetical protein [Lysinibacillus sphaericus]
MLSNEREEIAKEVVDIYTSFGQFTVESINEGSCEEYADYLNGQYARAGLSKHQTYSTLHFISPNANDDLECENMKDWREDAMALLGIPSDYFLKYRKQVESVDSRGMIPYHVWLFDGEHHYDATCLEGVKNPLELPFFQIFTNK